MNGQNKETKEGFIKGFGHPRKKELATLLLSGEATIESLAAAGFGRINVMEMARSIRQNVAGMQEFNMEWGRKVDVEVAKPAPAVEPEVVPEVTPTPEAEVPTATPEVTPEVVAPVVDETVAPTPEVVPEVTPETV